MQDHNKTQTANLEPQTLNTKPQTTNRNLLLDLSQLSLDFLLIGGSDVTHAHHKPTPTRNQQTIQHITGAT